MMKLIVCLLLSLSVFLSVSAQKQGVTDNDICKYRCVYTYLQDNYKNKDIKISANIFDLDRWMFPLDSLNDMPAEKSALKAFNEEHKKRLINEEHGILSDEIAAISKNVKEPKYAAFFSPIENNMMVAEVFPFNKRRDTLKNINDFITFCRFSESDLFLLIFDCNGNIKKVLTSHLITE